MAEMQAQQAYQQEAYQAQQSGTQQKQTSNTSNGAYSKASGKGDYLDFEEVK